MEENLRTKFQDIYSQISDKVTYEDFNNANKIVNKNFKDLEKHMDELEDDLNKTKTLSVMCCLHSFIILPMLDFD